MGARTGHLSASAPRRARGRAGRGSSPEAGRRARGPAPPANDDCLACHEDDSAARADGRPVVVKQAVFDDSMHGPLACVDCHQDLAKLTEFPHPEKLAKVDCATCHDTVRRSTTRACTRARARRATTRRGDVRRLPRHARHPAEERPGVAHLSPEPARRPARSATATPTSSEGRHPERRARRRSRTASTAGRSRGRA